MYSIPHFALAAIITCQFLIPPVAAERIIVGKSNNLKKEVYKVVELLNICL